MGPCLSGTLIISTPQGKFSRVEGQHATDQRNAHSHSVLNHIHILYVCYQFKVHDHRSDECILSSDLEKWQN